VSQPPGRSDVRLAELLGVLSLVSDLGLGLPMEHALRQCLIALRMADRLGLDEGAREATYYTGLLAWVGCHVDAYEQAKWFGDELAVKAEARLVDFSNTAADVAFVLRHLAAGRPMVGRARAALGMVATGAMKDIDAILETHWRAVDGLSASLGMNDDVRKSIEQTFERWDGRGSPHGAKGDDIRMTARLVNLADVVEVYHRAGGPEAACAVARERSGTQFDPELVELFCADAGDLLRDLDAVTTWDRVIEAEPGLAVPLADADLDAALEAIADFTDVKSPYTLGHSRGVADLAGDGASTVGLSAADATATRRAALVHDLGRLGVSNTIWDKEGELSVVEAERVRMHPYLTERTLASSPALAPLGAIAVQHHERLDGSGYPRGLKGEALLPTGRVLAAADVYRAKIEPRPHRTPASPAEAASILRAEVRAGRLDGDAVEAVLRAAGHRPRQRRDAVAGLTQREIEVLRLLARGLSTKQIAHQLRISRKTAANHVEHIYTKLGVNNRALASLFAAKHGLVDPEPDPAQPAGLA
jgi:HD-GYP domain-containing protein (c-di-GMP phosphodiesterase class II)